MKKTENGRSMIEMLGVLAIIGVLSVGALSGYRMAMKQYKVNELRDYMMRVVEGALHHGTTQKNGDIPYTGTDQCKEYVGGEAAPFGIKCYIVNANNFPNFAFTSAILITFYGAQLPQNIVDAFGTFPSSLSGESPFLYSFRVGCPSDDRSACELSIGFQK